MLIDLYEKCGYCTKNITNRHRKIRYLCPKLKLNFIVFDMARQIKIFGSMKISNFANNLFFSRDIFMPSYLSRLNKNKNFNFYSGRKNGVLASGIIII